MSRETPATISSADCELHVHCPKAEQVQRWQPRLGSRRNRSQAARLAMSCLTQPEIYHGSASCAVIAYARSTPFVASHPEISMEQILINLVAGALGGVGAGKSS